MATQGACTGALANCRQKKARLKQQDFCKYLIRIRNLAEWTGLEPATPGVTGRYSNQLNYHS